MNQIASMETMEIIPLFSGFPARSNRGFLGWSSCVLLKGEKNYLFDTSGYNERFGLLKALADHNLVPEDISTIFLSHFHFDHAVNYRLFPRATLCLHEIELAYARTNYQHDLAIPIEMLDDLQATGRLELLAGDDGSIENISWFLAPGHTAGLYALRLKQGSKTVVLASDAVKNIGELVTGKVAMAWNKQVSEKTIAGVVKIADVILPGHDRFIELVKDSSTGRKKFIPKGHTEVTISLSPDIVAASQEWTLKV